MKSTIVCSCDSIYFEKFAAPFIKGAQIQKIPTHINVINPNENVLELTGRLKDWAHKYDYDLEISTTQLEIPNEPIAKVIYSCGRIQTLVALMQRDVDEGISNNYFSVDIDSLILKEFRFPVNNEVPLAFYFRDAEKHGAQSEWERRGMRLLATFFINSKMLPYLKRVKMIIDNTKPRWFIDQVALYEAMCPQDIASSYDFSEDNIIGWDVETPFDFAVLTGKGDRKYLEGYQKLQGLFEHAIKKEMYPFLRVGT